MCQSRSRAGHVLSSLYFRASSLFLSPLNCSFRSNSSLRLSHSLSSQFHVGHGHLLPLHLRSLDLHCCSPSLSTALSLLHSKPSISTHQPINSTPPFRPRADHLPLRHRIANPQNGRTLGVSTWPNLWCSNRADGEDHGGYGSGESPCRSGNRGLYRVAGRGQRLVVWTVAIPLELTWRRSHIRFGGNDVYRRFNTLFFFNNLRVFSVMKSEGLRCAPHPQP